jgi:hypothetical protein
MPDASGDPAPSRGAKGGEAIATIEAIDGNVLAGIQMIEPGQTIDVTLPCTLRIGSCSIELSRPKAARASLLAGGSKARAGKRRWWLLPAFVTLAGAAALSLFGLSKMVTGQWAPSKLGMPRADSRPAVPKPAAAAGAAPAITVAAPPLPTLATAPATAVAVAPSVAVQKPSAFTPPKAAPPSDDRALADVRQRLQAAGLDKLLNVERRGNLLVVDGVVNSTAYGRWREVKAALVPAAAGGAAVAAYATTEGAVITDLVKTSTAASVPNNSIASVVLGKNAYVMSINGRRARVGEALEDGWIIESISADTVTMRRGQTVNRINPADGFPK